MAKGAHLTQRIKELIAQIHLEHPGYGATQVRADLLKLMKDEGIDRNFGPDYPSLSAVQKVLTTIRAKLDNRPPEVKGLDKPWSVSSLSKYPIPPEALPVVLKVYAIWETVDLSAYSTLATKGFTKQIFSVRLALWVARLSKLFSETAELAVWAFAYSLAEVVNEAVGEPQHLGEHLGEFNDFLLLRKLGLAEYPKGMPVEQLPGLWRPNKALKEPKGKTQKGK